MSFRRARPFSFALVALSLLAFPTACRDSVAPEPIAQQSAGAALPGVADNGWGPIRIVDTTVVALRWRTPLRNDITRRAVIGPEGGSISIEELGFEFTMPEGAVAVPTPVTVVAVAGSVVAYEFEPHGIRFEERATFSQELEYTELTSVLGVVMQGAYFKSRDDISRDGTARVSELIPTRLDYFPLRVKFPIKHFSGYIVAVD